MTARILSATRPHGTTKMEIAMEAWYPMKFPADVERAYALQLLQR
jgi:hypothetical protein